MFSSEMFLWAIVCGCLAIVVSEQTNQVWNKVTRINLQPENKHIFKTKGNVFNIWSGSGSRNYQGIFRPNPTLSITWVLTEHAFCAASNNVIKIPQSIGSASSETLQITQSVQHVELLRVWIENHIQ